MRLINTGYRAASAGTAPPPAAPCCRRALVRLLGVLAVALIFEGGWYISRRTNAVVSRQPPGTRT